MIYIRKNGIFYENSFKQDSEEYVFTRVESFIPYLTEFVHVDREITLEDIFSVLEQDEEMIGIIFGSHMGHNPLRPFINEIKRECMLESQEDYDYIECSWGAEQFDYKKFYKYFKKEQSNKEKNLTDNIFNQMPAVDGDEVNEISIYVDVHGWGKNEKDTEDEYYGYNESYEDGEEAPTHISYAIEFTPLYKIKHVPIRLNKEFIIREEIYSEDEELISVHGEKEFSVFDFFGAILSELTFAGTPEERDKKWDNIIDEFKKDKERREEDKEEGEDSE